MILWMSRRCYLCMGVAAAAITVIFHCNRSVQKYLGAGSMWILICYSLVACVSAISLGKECLTYCNVKALSGCVMTCLPLNHSALLPAPACLPTCLPACPPARRARACWKEGRKVMPQCRRGRRWRHIWCCWCVSSSM